MHVNAKKMAAGGIMLALSVIFMMLGNVLESSTFFFLAAASFFVGIVYREFGGRMGLAFCVAGILLGFLLAPNKLYVITYAAMGIYILIIETVWRQIGKRIGKQGEHSVSIKKFRVLFWLVKYLVFNIMYLTAVFGFRELFFQGTLSGAAVAAVVLVGEAALFLYDRAYEYTQGTLWNQMRRFLL
jgi:hypothetical protein